MMRHAAIWVVTAVLAILLGCASTDRQPLIPTRVPPIAYDPRPIQDAVSATLDYVEGRSETPPAAPTPAAANPQTEDAHAQVEKCRALIDGMRQRQPKLEALKGKGCLGEDNRGYVKLISNDALSDDEENEAQKLVHAENSDRKALYKEIARIENRDEVTLTVIERLYAKEHLKRAKSGEHVELPGEGPDFNEFKASPKGKALGEECWPEEWTTLP